jgi:hypothetical protein
LTRPDRRFRHHPLALARERLLAAPRPLGGGGAPADFSMFLDGERAKWTPLVKAVNVKAE